jgi:hypothetical protein
MTLPDSCKPLSRALRMGQDTVSFLQGPPYTVQDGVQVPRIDTRHTSEDCPDSAASASAVTDHPSSNGDPTFETVAVVDMCGIGDLIIGGWGQAVVRAHACSATSGPSKS